MEGTCQDHQVQFLAIHRTIPRSHTLCSRIQSVLDNTAKNQDLVKSKWVLMQTMLIKGILLHLLRNMNKIKVERLYFFNPWLFCDTSIHDYKAVIQLKILYQTDLPTAFLRPQHHKKNFSQHSSLSFLTWAHRSSIKDMLVRGTMQQMPGNLCLNLSMLSILLLSIQLYMFWDTLIQHFNRQGTLERWS